MLCSCQCISSACLVRQYHACSTDIGPANRTCTCACTSDCFQRKIMMHIAGWYQGFTCTSSITSAKVCSVVSQAQLKIRHLFSDTQKNAVTQCLATSWAYAHSRTISGYMQQLLTLTLTAHQHASYCMTFLQPRLTVTQHMLTLQQSPQANDAPHLLLHIPQVQQPC